MILTGPEIKEMVRRGEIVVEPYNEAFVEPNSYGIHLGNKIIEYTSHIIDSNSDRKYTETHIGDGGFVLVPDRFYLSHTLERIGGLTFASELYANFSTALCGAFIQTSAPLGHVGAVIRWTLEITVAHPIIVYPGMPIGKVCFWENMGSQAPYKGRYLGSETVVPSRI